MRPERPFMEAEVHRLIMVSFDINAKALIPHVPPGTELDTIKGRTFISLVGFVFKRPRVWGIGVPFHNQFEQVNLRFYVFRRTSHEVRRGAVFLQEIVSRRWVALAARKMYGENYIRLPMKHCVDQESPPGLLKAIGYGWRHNDRWNGIDVKTEQAIVESGAGSDTAFVTDRRWGYSVQNDGSCMEYAVQHPLWRLRRGACAGFEGEGRGLWGAEIAEALARPPSFSLWVEYSPFTVYPGHRLR